MKLRLPAIALATGLACAWASPALADPCEGALPPKGATFSGIVRYVGDGDGLCVGPAGRPDRWIEIRLADFYAPELHEPGGADAKHRLERAVMGKMLVCRAGRRSYDRVVAACTLAGRPIGDMRAAPVARKADEAGSDDRHVRPVWRTDRSRALPGRRLPVRGR